MAMVFDVAVQIALAPSMTRGPIAEYFCGAGLVGSFKLNLFLDRAAWGVNDDRLNIEVHFRDFLIDRTPRNLPNAIAIVFALEVLIHRLAALSLIRDVHAQKIRRHRNVESFHRETFLSAASILAPQEAQYS